MTAVSHAPSCLVCGAGPTVKAHLYPRALMHDARDGARHLVEGSLHHDGYRIRQSGMHDSRILCAEHERSLGTAGDYGVRFCRTFATRAKLAFGGSAFLIENARPERLEEFVLSVLWRHLVSEHARRIGSSLGPYEPPLRDVVFGAGRRGEYPFMISHPNFHLAGKPLTRVATTPFTWRLDGVNFWRFLLAGLLFDVKVDRRPFPRPAGLFCVANTRDPILVLRTDPQDIRQTQGIMEVVKRMGPVPERFKCQA